MDIYEKYLNYKNNNTSIVLNETNFCYSRRFKNKYKVQNVEKFNNFTFVTCHCLDENLEKIIVLNDNNKIVSYAEFIYKQDSTFIAKVYTHPSYRQLGLCRKAISIIEGLSKVNNYNKPIRLNCERRIEDDKNQNRNYDFYKRLGFIDYVEEGVMRKSYLFPMIKYLGNSKDQGKV